MSQVDLWEYWQSIGNNLIYKDVFKKTYDQIKIAWEKT